MPMKIYTADALRRLRDAFDLKGKHDLQLDEVIVPVAVVANLAPQESLINQPVQYRFEVPTNVGVGKAVLFNGVTSDSGRDIIIDRVDVSNLVTLTWMIHHTTNAPVTPIAASTLDQSFAAWPQVGTVPGRMFADSGALTGVEIEQFQAVANTRTSVQIDQRLGFQQGLVVSPVATNQTFQVTMFGRIVPRI